ncbi:MAG: type III-B CRISPR module RAMP protein Cmr1 [Candidatus Acidulodesulfobacterium sp.]
MIFYINRFSGIERKTYEVEIITPMFLVGADHRKAELRVPPIKGMLRFWWRALHPDLTNSNKNYKKLRDEESKLFGDAGDIYGKSKVKIQFLENYKLRYDSHNPFPHKQVNFNFKGFNVNQSFKIVITSPEEIHKLFEFSTIVGGLGKRSRRGFGGLVVKYNNISDLSIINRLYNLIKEINTENIYKKSNNEEFSFIEISQNYPNANYPYLKRIQTGKEKSDYKVILKTIGQSSHDNNSNYTGFVRGKERFSSPIYVSITKHGSSYIPVISMLNVAFKNKQNNGIDKSEFFINDILEVKIKENPK